MLTYLKEFALLSGLLGEVLKLPPDKRDQWLKSLRPEAATYEEDLRSLLKYAESMRTEDFLRMSPGVQAVADAYIAMCRPKLAPGFAIGPYVIEREIGFGGMGSVWLARRSDGIIKRPVALKLPHSGPLDRGLIDRFERERNILAELTHSNIARLYDAGVSVEGQPYLALEYVAGVPITVYCDEHRLDIRQRLQLFQQVLRAVQYAHNNLVVHRDLKPSNVIVGSDGSAMLLDFGIAKLISTESIDNGPGTQLSPLTLALTPEYASPEQITGQAITTASDIYSLGILLFELLTGQSPYRLDHPTPTVLEEAILVKGPHWPSHSILTEEAAGIRASTVRTLARVLRGDLDAIVLKALARKPDDRYLTADALSADIHSYLAGEPIAVRKDSWYRVRKFILRNRLSVASASVAVAALIATTGIALHEARVAAAHARTAAAERDRAVMASERKAVAGEFLNLLITEAARSNKPVAVADLVSRSETLLNREYQDVPEDRAAVLDVVSGYYDMREEYSRSEQLSRQALDLVKSSPDGDLRRSLTCSYAETLAKVGNTLEAKRMLNSVLLDPLITQEQSARCLNKLARVAQLRGDGPDALKYAQQALQRLRRSRAHPSPALEADFLADIGSEEYINGHNDASAHFFSLSLEQMKRAGLDRSRESLAIRNNWAVTSKSAGNPRVALELIDQALHMTADDLDAVPFPTLLINRAASLEELGRYSESRDAYLSCVAEFARTGVHGATATALLSLASVSQELDDLVSAKKYLAAAEDDLGGSSGLAGVNSETRLRIVRASLELREGRLQEARADLDRAIVDAKDLFWGTRALVGRAELNLHEGNLVAAEADARRSLSFAEEAQGSALYSNRTGLAWLMLGRVLQRQGGQTTAREAYEKAVTNLKNTVDANHPKLVLALQLLAGVSSADR